MKTLLVSFLLLIPLAQAVPVLEITSPGNGTLNGDYTTTKLFVNELKGDSIPLTVRFQPNEANLTKVEVFTNLNRRERALLDADGDSVQDGILPPDASLVVAGSDAHYYKADTMTDAGGGWYEITLHAEKTGAYRLTARFETNHSGTWQWYGARDHAVVVSPSLARDMTMYELNPLNIEAEGTLENQRSTLVDLWDGPGSKTFQQWNLNYVQSLGANWLWFQPIHPFGVDGRHLSSADINARDPGSNSTTWRWNGGSPVEDVNYPFAFGSPYAVKNFWEVEPRLSKANTRAGAMTEFQDFVSAADSAEVSIMLDAAFNHTAWDVESGTLGSTLGFGSATTEIRNAEARFFSRDGDYHNQAFNAGSIAPAPDRFDFNKWLDAKDVYFGRYAALWQNSGSTGAQQAEGDWFDYTTATGRFNEQTRNVWRYFGQYVPYWLDKTGHPDGTPAADHHKGIDGLRCDFGQGLPPQCWEYIINVARSSKWSFVFMAESLDGGAVTYRSNRHFDILNENIVFAMKGSSTVPAFRSAFESRRSAYGQGLVLFNTVSHDENNYVDPWEALLRYGVYSTIGGVPMIFYGQEQGLSEFYGFDLQERNVGKFIPHFKTYNSMMPLWNDTDFGNAQLYPVYAGINAARRESPALRGGNRYFLSLSGGGTHNEIWSAAKYEQAGASPAFRDVVFGFMNVDRDSDHMATFDVNVAGGGGNLFGIQSGRTYNVKNRAAYTGQDPTRRDDWLWGAGGRSGADILTNGVTVIMNRVPTTEAAWSTAPFEAQYLKLYDVTPPPPPGVPEEEDFQLYVVGSQVTFVWVASGGFGDHVTGFRVDVGTTPGGDDVADGVSTDSPQITVSGMHGQTLYATVYAVSSAGIESPTGSESLDGVTLLDPAGDEDGDGASNADEDVAGTDVFDPASLFGWESIMRNGASIDLRYRSVPGRLYTIQSSTDMVNWNAEDEPDAEDSVAGPGSVTLFTDLNPEGTPTYYRVLVRKP